MNLVENEELEDQFAGNAGGEILDYDDDDGGDVEDTGDGGAIVKIGDDKSPAPDMGEFFTNLVETIPASELSSIIVALTEAIAQDIKDREPRDKQYEEGIKRTGIAQDAPGGASFAGASRATHPMITKAAIDFGARAIKELFPPDGPVKSFIAGDPTKDRQEKADRKVRHMNWQLVFQIPEFRDSLEQIFPQMVLGGVQYQRWVWWDRRKRPSPSFVPVDKCVIPFSASSFYTAERQTFIDDITELEYERRVADGLYVDSATLASSTNVPDPSLAEAANLRIEGKEASGINLDGFRRVYETAVELDLSEWDKEADGEARPYLVRIDKDSNKPLGIVRNWDPEGNPTEPMVWIVEWPFIPWRGAMPIGLAQLIAGLSVAATGALRALLDSAHVNNTPTLVKLKGLGIDGQSINVQACEAIEVEGTVGMDDIRKLVMAVPFNQPSEVLYQLLGFLVNEGAAVVRTTFEDLAEQKADMPVGTTLALIEQGMAVMSAIHARLFTAMQRTLQVLHRLNRMYLTDPEVRNQAGELLARKSDYQGPEDVIPVADPRIFSEVQRFAQMQVVAERADKHPELYNARKVEMLILERLKFPHPEQLLVAPPDAKEMNAVNENVAMTLGRPVTAFPEQDHLAHIQTLVEYLESPFFGMLPMIQPKFIPPAIQHLVEHMTLWYASRVYEHASSAVGKNFEAMLTFKDPETRQEVDKTLAMASTATIDEAGAAFAKLPPIIAKAFDIVNKLQANMHQDPTVQGALQVEQVRGQNAQQLEQVRQQGKQATTQMSLADRQQALQLKVVDGKQHAADEQAKREADMQLEQMRAASSQAIAQETNETRTAINNADNATAISISSAEIEAGHKSALSTGTGLGKG